MQLPYPVEGSSWTSGGLINGHTYQYRLTSEKGSAVATDLFSDVVSVRPGVPAAVSRPTLAPGSHALVARWPAAALATSYRVEWRAAGQRTWAQTTTTGSSLTLQKLVAGQRYDVRVTGLRSGLAGAPSPVASAVAGGTRPGRVVVVSAHRARQSVRLRWRAAVAATRYVLERRDTEQHGSWVIVRRLGAHAHVATVHLPRRHHSYAVRVVAYDQLLPGPASVPRYVRSR